MSENALSKQEDFTQGVTLWQSSMGFELGQRMAVALCSSTLVPMEYRGQENLGSCLIAIDMAARMNLSPLEVMQNLYVVNGKPAWSAKFLIARINKSGKFKSDIRFEFKGAENTDGWSCRAFVTDEYGDRLNGPWVSIKMAKDEGWYSRKGSKWPTMPELMLQYRAATFFQRVHAADVLFGSTTDELEDMGIKVQDVPSHEIEELDMPPVGEVIHDLEPAPSSTGAIYDQDF